MEIFVSVVHSIVACEFGAYQNHIIKSAYEFVEQPQIAVFHQFHAFDYFDTGSKRVVEFLVYFLTFRWTSQLEGNKTLHVGASNA